VSTGGDTITNQLKFVLTEGSTEFIVGDGFDITIAAGSGNVRLLDVDAIDGSAVFDSILLEDTDATSGDLVAPVALTGQFNEDKLTVKGSTVTADYEDAARDAGCFIEPTTDIQ